MRTIYNIATFIASAILRVAALFNSKLSLMVKGQSRAMKDLESDIANDPSNKVWFHAASLGEFEQGRPVIEAYRKRFPDTKIVLTFFSPSGYEVRKNYSGADYTLYLPLDTPYNAKRFVAIVKPKFALFIKYEFWPNYIHYLAKKSTPIYSISSIFRPSQIFFKPYGILNRSTLKKISHFYVQGTESEELLNSIGINDVTVTGDTRFDRVLDIVNNAKDIQEVSDFVGDSNSIVVGSSWRQDEKIISEAVDSIKLKRDINIKLVIAPHEIDEVTISKVEASFSSRNIIRFSQIDRTTDLSLYDTLIIDNIGMLSSLYRYGQISYIGGGFGVGIHNTLEAAAYGMPVLFGPNYSRFAEAVNLINREAAFTVKNSIELTEIIDRLYSSPEQLKRASTNASDVVAENRGATDIILKQLH